MLTGKTAIVTGGTRGIGLAITKKYLENGAKVAICGSREETVNKALDELKKQFPSSDIIGISPNLRDYNSIKEEFTKVYEHFGKIDILVNNAGISAKESIFEYKPEDFQKIMDINVTAVFFASKVVSEFMKEQGGGCILNTSSMVSKYGQPSGCGYPASKFAVNGLTISLARELANLQIRVNAVAPGVTETDMVAALPEDMRNGIISTIPIGRMGQPNDIANAFLYLASDLASYVTGTILSVDGASRS